MCYSIVVVIKRNTVTRTHIRWWRTRALARAEARLNASVFVSACALVRARVRERVAMSSRTKRVDVCEECKVRGRRGSKRVNRALRHSRRKEVMCNNARPMCMHRFLIIIAKEPDRFRTKSRRTLHMSRERERSVYRTFMYLLYKRRFPRARNVTFWNLWSQREASLSNSL